MAENKIAIENKYRLSEVKTTGKAGGLIGPYKGLIPASANRALMIWQSHPYHWQPPSSGGSFTFSYLCRISLWACPLFPALP